MFADRLKGLGTESAFRIGPHIKEVEATGRRVIKCNFGEPDFPVPAHIREEVKRQLDAGMTGYCDPQGILPLREAIARDVGAKRRLSISPDQVVVFPGAKPAIGLCQEAYCNPGDEVVYPSPAFPIYESFTQYVGAKPVPHHVGQEFESLITPRTKLIFLNSPGNPTGAVATRKELEAISEVILQKASNDVRIFSDEIYENILFDGLTHESIASIPGMAERTIISSGASKSYSWTGGRVGWAVFPTAEEAEQFKNLNINYFSCVPAYSQMGAKVGIESAESKKSIATMVAAFQERRDAVVSALNAIEGVTCEMPKGAFYVFPNVSGLCERIGAIEAYGNLAADAQSRTSPSTLVQMFLLYRYGVALLDRRAFGVIGSQGQHFLRISIATGKDDLLEAVARISQAAKDSSGFRAYLESR